MSSFLRRICIRKNKCAKFLAIACSEGCPGRDLVSFLDKCSRGRKSSGTSAFSTMGGGGEEMGRCGKSSSFCGHSVCSKVEWPKSVECCCDGFN